MVRQAERHPTGGYGDLTYPEVGATAEARLPAGYQHLDLEQPLGHGADWFSTARQRLLSWEMHRGAGLEVAGSVRVELASDAVLRLPLGPFGITAPVRVVAVEDESSLAGFAYGTLGGHPESGEERFEVRLASDGTVWARIRAFSRPAGRLARWGGPLTRLAQLRITGRYLAALTAPDARP